MTGTLRALLDGVANGVIPVVLAAVLALGAWRKVRVYEAFIDGAKEGFDVAVRIIPYLVAVLVAVGMVREAGLLDLLARLTAPVLAVLGVPPETLPMMLIRPLSGSGASVSVGDGQNKFNKMTFCRLRGSGADSG